jgi:hypothetical protein
LIFGSGLGRPTRVAHSILLCQQEQATGINPKTLRGCLINFAISPMHTVLK